MKYDAPLSPVSILASRYAPFNSSLSSSAYTSTTSVWSDTASQSSDDTAFSSQSSDPDSNSYFTKSAAADSAFNYQPCIKKTRAEIVPAELRQNSRRTSNSNRAACPPTLVRQSDRKVNFVDSLVGMFQCRITHTHVLLLSLHSRFLHPNC